MIVIIKFLKSNEFEMASQNWMVRDADGENMWNCLLPKKTPSQNELKMMIKKDVIPDVSWIPYPCKIYKKFESKELNEASQWLRRKLASIASSTDDGNFIEHLTLAETQVESDASNILTPSRKALKRKSLQHMTLVETEDESDTSNILTPSRKALKRKSLQHMTLAETEDESDTSNILTPSRKALKRKSMENDHIDMEFKKLNKRVFKMEIKIEKLLDGIHDIKSLILNNEKIKQKDLFQVVTNHEEAEVMQNKLKADKFFDQMKQHLSRFRSSTVGGTVKSVLENLLSVTFIVKNTRAAFFSKYKKIQQLIIQTIMNAHKDTTEKIINISVDQLFRRSRNKSNAEHGQQDKFIN